MDQINNDKRTLEEGRTNKLKDVEVSLRDQIPAKLRRKLLDMGIGEKITSLWRLGNADREAWLERQRAYLLEFDEFIEEIYGSSVDWGSALHLPVTLSVAKTFHARFQSALIGIDPPFNVRARQGANAERAPMIQELMRYTVLEWANKYQGIDDFVDRWLWDWVTAGCAISKVRWHEEFTRFVDVEKQSKPAGVRIVQDPQTGESSVQQEVVEEDVEVTKLIKTYDCPMIERVPVEDLLIIGGEGDPQNAETVIQQSYMNASQLWTLVDQGVFDEEAVNKVIEGGGEKRSSESVNQIKMLQKVGAGESELDKPFEHDKYQVLECYVKVDVDGSGINSDVIVWINPNTREVLRATYLWRVMKTGKRPFYKIDFHKRAGATYGVGLVEMLYSLSKEIDAMHNIRMDIGILASQPFGFYRPTASMSEERLPIEPGALVPLDNPQTDVFFPNLGNRTSFAFQEEQSLMSYVERLTATSDITYGVIGGQGATRTATGTRALMQETNANLDVYIRRMNKGWKGIVQHVFNLLQEKLPEGFEFRLLGDDGHQYFRQVRSREELQGNYDFILEANSSNSNKNIQIDVATQIYQLTGNPLDLQLGIVSPIERYEAIKNMLQAMGVKDFSRFIRKPNGLNVIFTPMEVANRTLAGVPTPLDPTQDLQGFVTLVDEMFNDDMIMGQFNEEQVLTLAAKQREAQQLLQAIQAQQAQMANIQQQRLNAATATSPTQPIQNMGAPAPTGSEQQ